MDNSENNEKELLSKALIIARELIREKEQSHKELLRKNNVLVVEREIIEHQLKHCKKLSILSILISIISICTNLYFLFN